MIVIVVGMHRSGTSSIAGLLHMSGISMGPPWTMWPRPRPENPKGYYENVFFRAANDVLLRRRGYKTKSYDARVPPMLETTARETFALRQLVRLHDAPGTHWGFKDPRTCLTLGSWIRVLDAMGRMSSTRIVFVSRSAEAVARSLHRRVPLIPEVTFLELWASYTERALTAIDSAPASVHYTSYESFCADPIGRSRELFAFLGQPPADGTVARFFDTQLNRSGREASTKSPAALVPHVRRVNELIQARLPSRSAK